MPRAKRSRRGCETCRRRHIKCDETLPTCKRCEESNRRCFRRSFISVWQNDKISPQEEKTRDICNWIETPKRLVFVSENGDGPDTPSGPAISPAHLDETAQGSPGVIQTFQTSPVRASLSPVQTKSPTRMSRTLPSPHPSSETAHGRSPRNSISAHSNHFSPPQAQRSLSGQHGSPMTANDPSSPLTTVADHHCRRLNSRIESMLLQNFVKELASWFDVTDPNGHFHNVVPERALRSDVVLNATLAISALHLNSSSQNHIDAVLADVYHTKCIGMLITLINEEVSATNDDVLAAAVILRKFEEMRGYVTEQDSGNHLLGVSALFNSRSCAVTGGLAEAAFWQFVRQDAFLSLYLHQSPRIDFSKQDYVFSVSEAPDYVWANRIIFCAVMILTYCFSNQSKSLATWKELNDQVNAWATRRPVSFTPLFFEAPSIPEGRYWPVMHFYAPWHATGTQYFHLCKILLSLYKPDIHAPGSGLRYNRAHREMQDAIVGCTRPICGIAKSNNYPNAKFNMCPVMLMCGGWITDPNEQRMVLDTLSDTEKVHGWPTRHVRNSLEDHWGMQISSR